MLHKYYVNNSAQQNGDHEVHEEHCTYLKMAHDVEYLGMFENGIQAVAYARKFMQRQMVAIFAARKLTRAN